MNFYVGSYDHNLFVTYWGRSLLPPICSDNTKIRKTDKPLYRTFHLNELLCRILWSQFICQVFGTL